MRILLVTHEVSRSGAPRIALLAARCLVDQGHRVTVVSRARGPLLPEFEQTAPTSVEFLSRLRRRLWRVPVGRRLALLVDVTLAMFSIVVRRPDLVYINSSSAAIYLKAALLLRSRALLHVHESGALTRQFLRTARVPTALPGVTLVACSPSVQSALCDISGRPLDGVLLVHSVPNIDEVVSRSGELPDRSYATELVIGCCGTVEHRKGSDLWVDIAARVRRALPDLRLRFVWVGDISEPVAPDANAMGVEFVGPSSNPYAHMRRFDVSTLPSRDDPFPLVVLESMAVGTPVVAFAVGSVATQIGDTGVVVPPLDTGAFARAVVRLLSDAGERERLGAAAHDRVIRMYSTETFSAALSDAITRLVTAPRGGPIQTGR